MSPLSGARPRSALRRGYNKQEDKIRVAAKQVKQKGLTACRGQPGAFRKQLWGLEGLPGLQLLAGVRLAAVLGRVFGRRRSRAGLGVFLGRGGVATAANAGQETRHHEY